MEDNFDCNLFINKDYVEKEFIYKDCSQKYKASISASTDFDLTGQIVWRAAEQLAEFIIENKEIFKDKIVLELGAGVGLSGLVCAQYAKQVFITDGNDIVCELIDINTQYAANKNVVSDKFQWGQNDFLEKYKDIHFDIIIGADIMFWFQAIEPLAITFKQFLDKFPKLTIFSATRVRAGVSENLFDTHLGERKLHREVLYSEGQNNFYKISVCNSEEQDQEEQGESHTKKNEIVYVIPHQG